MPNPYKPPNNDENPQQNSLLGFLWWLAEPLAADPIAARTTVMIAIGFVMVAIFWALDWFEIIQL